MGSKVHRAETAPNRTVFFQTTALRSSGTGLPVWSLPVVMISTRRAACTHTPDVPGRLAQCDAANNSASPWWLLATATQMRPRFSQSRLYCDRLRSVRTRSP